MLTSSSTVPTSILYLRVIDFPLHSPANGLAFFCGLVLSDFISVLVTYLHSFQPFSNRQSISLHMGCEDFCPFILLFKLPFSLGLIGPASMEGLKGAPPFPGDSINLMGAPLLFRLSTADFITSVQIVFNA